MPTDPDPTSPPPPAPDDLRRQVLETVHSARRKLTPLALETAVAGALQAGRRAVRAAVRELVAARELTYTSHFGCSFLEPSFNRPVRVSARVVVKPPACRFTAEPGDLVIDLAPGSAFGSGEHPTTRLALQGLESFLPAGQSRLAGPGSGAAALDIGTGSGILVIAAVALGLAGRGVGIDIDPCALSEARANVRLNRLQDRIAVTPLPLEELSGTFCLVTANLRAPSLARMAAGLSARLEAGGGLVVSGLRAEEAPSIEEVCGRHGLEARWRGGECGWGALAFRKGG